MFYRLKKQCGRIYLTRVWYENGVRREKSVGPVDLIEKIMRDWRRKNGRSRLRVGWWARWDLNPGPPPRKGGVLTRLDDGPIRDISRIHYFLFLLSNAVYIYFTADITNKKSQQPFSTTYFIFSCKIKTLIGAITLMGWGPVAQLEERCPRTAEVPGSNPGRSTKPFFPLFVWL